MIPLLYTTHNRLEFTKKTLPQLFKNTLGDVLFIIIDTGSIDGTVEYLRQNLDKIAGEKNYRLFTLGDMRLSEAMDFFFENALQYDFKYAAKVDNDTIVPTNWLSDMITAANDNDIDILQARHYIMNNNVKDWDEWTSQMKQIEYDNNKIFLNDFVGGSGIVFKRRTMLSFSKQSYSQNRLHGWTQTQSMHKEWIKAFYNGVFIELLDMKDDNVPSYELYPEYYTYTQRKI